MEFWAAKGEEQSEMRRTKKMEQKVYKSSANHIAQLHYDPDDIACSGRWSSRTEKVYCSLVGFLGVSYLVDGTKSHSDMRFP